jgi:hypothetical protein
MAIPRRVKSSILLVLEATALAFIIYNLVNNYQNWQGWTHGYVWVNAWENVCVCVCVCVSATALLVGLLLGRDSPYLATSLEDFP